MREGEVNMFILFTRSDTTTQRKKKQKNPCLQRNFRVERCQQSLWNRRICSEKMDKNPLTEGIFPAILKVPTCLIVTHETFSQTLHQRPYWARRILMRTLNLALMLSALAGCTGGPCDGADCAEDTDVTCDSCTDDTGDTDTAVGSLEVIPTKLGNTEHCQVNYVGVDELSWNTADEPIKEGLKVGSFTATFGDPTKMTDDSSPLPIHTDGGGDKWVSPAAGGDIPKNDKETVQVVFTRRIDADYLCAYHNYRIMGDGSENDVGITNVNNGQKFRVKTVTDGDKHYLDSGPIDWGIGADVVPRIVGETLLEEIDSDNTILSSAISVASPRFVWKTDGWARYDMRCCLAESCAVPPSGF